MHPIEATESGLVLDTSDDSFVTIDSNDSSGTETEPVTPTDPAITAQLTPEIYVSQEGEDGYDTSESVRCMSMSSEGSDIRYPMLPTPRKRHRNLRSRSAGRIGGDNHGVMTKWMKSLRGRSRLPENQYDIYKSQAPRDSVAGNLSIIAPSAMTSATKLTASTNFMHRVYTATASRISLSYYGSVAGFSKRDPFEQVDLRMEDPLDLATLERAQQRWKILAEIVLSEEAYIMDLRTMIEVFSPLKDNVSSVDSHTKRRIADNMTDLLEHQENLLSELFTRLPASIGLPSKPVGRSFSGLPLAEASPTYEKLADPSLVESLADVFESRMLLFFAHIEYSANYEKLREMVNAYTASSPKTRSWESGFEMLANAISAECSKDTNSGKKAATLSDLIIKPIHHICRYPLLLNRLLDVTPTIDAPEANESLQRVIKTLRDLGSELNSVQANDSGARDQLEKTWLLREMISLPKGLDGASDYIPPIDRRKSVLRHLGRVVLCGILQVAYSTKDGVIARYTIGSLYRTHLLLARPTVDPATQKAVCSVMFMIPLAALKSDDIQDRSLPDAEFSWKINFRKANRLYRIRLSAKTADDAEVWRSSLSKCIDEIDPEASSSTTRLSYLPIDIRSRENDDKVSSYDLRTQYSIARSPTGLVRARSQPLAKITTSMDQLADSPMPSPTQQHPDKSLEKYLRRNADLERFLTDRKEEVVSRLWPEQRNTLENLFSEVISSEVLSAPRPSKKEGRPQGRFNTMNGRSMSASQVDEGSLMRKISLSGIWPSRKRSSASATLEVGTRRPSRISIPERNNSLRPQRSKSDHSGSAYEFSTYHASLDIDPFNDNAQVLDDEDKENWTFASKPPSRTRSLLSRFSPEKRSVSSTASSPVTTAPVSPVVQMSHFSDKHRIPSRDFGISGPSLISMQGRIKKSFRGKGTFKKFFSG